MTTLFQAMLETAKALQTLRASVATGGSTTTLIDALMSEPDDWFNGGTIFFLSGANAGATRTITDWVESTGTFTFATATAIAAGVRYAATQQRYRREALVQAINTALQDIGPVPAYDDTLDVVDGQEEYDLPAGVSDVARVQVAANASAPYEWETHYFWREVAGEIHFLAAPPTAAGNPIRLWYVGQHAEVTLDTDVISDAIHPQRLAYEAAYQAAKARVGLSENTESALSKLVEILDRERARMANRHPIRFTSRDAILAHH